RRLFRAQRRRQVVGRDHVAPSHDDEPLDHVPELPHVAGPIVGQEIAERLAGERLRALAVLGAELGDEVAHVGGDVVLARAQRGASAPVNAPFSWPNSSDSISSSGMAAQLTSTKGRSRRADCTWMARATSSLPLPFSPWISTRPVVGAAVVICSRSTRIAALSPTISARCSKLARRAAFSRSSRAC